MIIVLDSKLENRTNIVIEEKRTSNDFLLHLNGLKNLVENVQ